MTLSSHNRVVRWACDNRLPEDERELELVVEVWVEPQHGVVVEEEIPDYLHGKQYFEIPAKVMVIKMLLEIRVKSFINFSFILTLKCCLSF